MKREAYFSDKVVSQIHQNRSSFVKPRCLKSTERSDRVIVEDELLYVFVVRVQMGH